VLRSLYNWTLSLAERRGAMWALAVIAFLESSIFPIPPDVLIIAMVLAQPKKAYQVALVATVASVLGGLAGYLIGYGAYTTIGQPILETLGKAHLFEEFQAKYNEWGVWVVLIGGLSPFPYKVITILSGATGLSLPVFIVSSIIARGLRFYVVAALLKHFGPPIKEFIEKRLGLVFTVFLALLIGGFVLASRF